MKPLLLLIFLSFYATLPAQGFSKEIDKSFPKAEPMETTQASSQEELNQRLIQACGKGDLQEVKQSLAEGADIDTKTDFTHRGSTAKNVTPLIVATLKKHNDIANYLLSKNANIHYSFSAGSHREGVLHNITPLVASLIRGNREIFHKLLQRGANTDIILHGHMNGTEIKSASLLSMYIFKGKKDLIQHLLLFNADVNIPSHMESGIKNIRMKNFFPIHFAAMEGNQKLLRMLLVAGAKVNVKADFTHSDKASIQQITPLMIAADKGNTTLVKILILFGAHLDDKASGTMKGESIDGYTALDFAQKKNHQKVVKILEEAMQQQDSSTIEE